MIKITERFFFENLCVLLICYDAPMSGFKEHITTLFEPSVDTVHVCVSEKLNIFKRAKFMRQIREVFTDADIQIRTVTESQIKILAFYISGFINTEKSAA